MADMLQGFGLLDHFSGLFSVLLVFIVLFAIFQNTKALGDNKMIHAIGALLIAAIFGFSPAAQGIIGFMAPWFVVLFFFIIFVIVSFKIFGATDADVIGIFRTRFQFVAWWIIAFAVIIALFAFSGVFGQSLLSTTTGVISSGQSSSAGGQQVIIDPETGQEIIIVSDDTGTDLSTSGTASSDFNKNLYETLFHPKIIGLIFILLVASFTVRFLVSQ